MSNKNPGRHLGPRHRGRHGKRHRRGRLGLFAVLLSILALAAIIATITSTPLASAKIVKRAHHPLSATARLHELASEAQHVPSSPLPTGALYSTAIQHENLLPGTSAWRITGPQSGTYIEGYASSTSVPQGQSFKVFVSDQSPSFRIEAFRMGYYQGLLGRHIWTSPQIPSQSQPACPVASVTNMVNCNWAPSLTIRTTAAWVPGDYLLKLVSNNDYQSYVPITVVNYSSNAAVLLINAVTTWQAYNKWGGWDLYAGPNIGQRSTMVSFNRPYSYYFGQGAADFIGNELPMVALAEKMGLNATYITSVDIQQHPMLLQDHSEVLSLGHDEYWSPTMRQGITAAREHGVNLAFLGANAIFRRIRFASSANGPDRIEINYRIASLDPMYGVNNQKVTTNWPSPPVPDPEGNLIGIQYQCNPVDYPMIITDPSAWVFNHTGLTMGAEIPNLVGSEFDGYGYNYTPPPTLQLLANSPVLCHNVPYFSDMSYYTAPSGAGVFATGTNLWVAAVGINCAPPLQNCPISPVVKITENVIEAFGNGPASTKYPATPNAASVSARPPYGPLRPIPPPTTTTSTTAPRTYPSTTLPPSKSSTSTTASYETSTTIGTATGTTSTPSTTTSTTGTKAG